MASSDHLTTASLIDPWIRRPASFLDPWFADAFSRDTDTLTRALQFSLSSPFHDSNSNTTNTSSSDTSLAADVVSSFHIPAPGLNNTTYSGSGSGSGFDSFEIENVMLGEEIVRCAEAPVPKQRQRNNVVVSGKVAKKKSRVTKRSQTTFISVDTASFRQMVQQVTGSRLGHNPAINNGQMMQPEPHRPGSDLSSNNCSSSSSLGCSAITAECLPTLDTSALLLDRHRAQDQQHAAEMVGEGSTGAFTDDLEQFVSFPTLDSWNSM